MRFGDRIRLETEIEEEVNYHPPSEVEASCFIDQTCCHGFILKQ
ncbi:hypothetical protein [Caldicellulosiruptor acetigenus]|nr:hypothetical protein [Caldicellulosiruptor acetigenus]